MIKPTFSADISSVLTLQNQIKLLTLDAIQRKKLLRLAAFAVRKASRQNIKQQKDYLGRSFEARRKGRKKMFKGLSRYMTAYSTNDQGVVTWKNPLMASIARAHQEGIDTQVKASALTKKQGKKKPTDAATIEQARQLKKAGFKVRENGKRKVPTIKWILENLSLAQAGFILRLLRGAAPQQWTIPLPERAFLGIDEKELNGMIKRLFDQITDQAGVK